MTVVGDGAALCHDYLLSAGIPCDLAPAHLRLQSAVGVGMAAWRIWPQGAVSPQDLRPNYLRLSQAERERLAREREELETYLAEAGFGPVTVTGDLTGRPPAPEEDRWIFHCQKPINSK